MPLTLNMVHCNAVVPCSIQDYFAYVYKKWLATVIIHSVFGILVKPTVLYYDTMPVLTWHLPWSKVVNLLQCTAHSFSVYFVTLKL